MFIYQFFRLLKRSAVAWISNDGAMFGAALAFYSAFSLAPLLLIAIGMASAVVGDNAAQSGLSEELRQVLGPAAADAVIAMLKNANATGEGTRITIVGLGTLLLGASGAFVQLQTALNVIWSEKSSDSSLPVTSPAAQAGMVKAVLLFIRKRLLSFGAVLVTGLLLLALLGVNSTLAALHQGVSSTSLFGSPALWQGLSMLVSFCFTALLFALIFKLLPDTPVRWADAGKGAILTAVLFTIGQYLIGMYLGQASIGSTFGAAGSLVILLVWVYYSAQIVLFGAEFAHACAMSPGRHTA
jgi:membrane protein